MLDRKYILDNVDAVKANVAARLMDVNVDRFVVLEGERRAVQQEIEAVRAEGNALAKNREVSVDDKREQGRALKDKETELNAKIAPIEAELNDIYLSIPNMTDAASPSGGEEESVDIARGATTIRDFSGEGFEPKDHITLMEKLNMVDLERAAKVSGSGFYYLTGAGAMLELALTRFAMDRLVAAGYTPVLTPDLVRDDVMVGAGFVPRGNESNTYQLDGHDLSLIATSEITLVGRYRDEILEASALPLKMAGLSHCFRSERAHGSLTRGIYRVHQFSKVEMVVICAPEDAEKVHFELRDVEQKMFDDLGIPYRVLEIAAGDLGAAAYRKFDLEAWMPGRNGGSWGEVTSTSNCTDFQARRLGIRMREAAGEKPRFAATLNGTALSMARAIIALVENHQTADGQVRIPAALVPYFGADVIK
ncbi:MAG: serine--tRNA ligase [Alphaproteobacteria bacterium CG_4_10_14_0_8_um_filter_53_9]|nr:MAG: serine--tRNA ligase [Alphaproteobacteria bacterium CG_4_10_14_0_8_um_filter_53_9]